MQDKIIDSVGKNVIPIIVLAVVVVGGAYFIISKIGSGLSGAVSGAVDSVVSGNILKSNEQIAEEKARNEAKKAEMNQWLEKELKLPADQKTKFTRQYSKDLADALYAKLNETVIDPWDKNQIYELMGRVGTTGSLYFLFWAYGTRNNKTLAEALRDVLGFSSPLYSNLKDLNALYKKRKINYTF